METGLIVFLALLALYVVFVVWLVQTKRLEKWNLSLLLGIILMVRTQRGKGTIDFIAKPKRFWNFVGDLGIGFTLFGMLGMTALLLWSVWLVLQPDSGIPALGPTEIFVIPGVTPFVPLVYGLVGLIVTLVVHEGGHGVLARANGMKLKSIGLLVAIVPIGAFVEPDDLDVKVASRRQRLRVYGAGPAVNFGFAAIALTAFALLMGSLTPVPGAHVAGPSVDGPADKAGIDAGDVILDARHAGGEWQHLANWDDMTRFLNASRPGEHIDLFLLDTSVHPVTLGSHWDRLSTATREAIIQGKPEAMEFCRAAVRWPPPETGGECASRLQSMAFVGISPFLPMHFAALEDPLGSGGANMLRMFSLPLAEIGGGESYLGVYVPSFYEPPFTPAVYWPLVNVLFWIFWINLAVGVTNILPMLPLDGGHIFRDAAGGVYQKLRPGLTTERRERLVNLTVGAVSITILAAFLIQIFGPYVMRGWS